MHRPKCSRQMRVEFFIYPLLHTCSTAFKSNIIEFDFHYVENNQMKMFSSKIFIVLEFTFRITVGNDCCLVLILCLERGGLVPVWFGVTLYVMRW